MGMCKTVKVEKKENGNGNGEEDCGFFKKYNPDTGKCEWDYKKLGLIGGAVGIGIMLSKE